MAPIGKPVVCIPMVLVDPAALTVVPGVMVTVECNV